MEDYEVVESRQAYKGKVLSVRIDDVRMPSGRVVEREVITHGGAVGIVPLTDEEGLILVKQYRHAVGKFLLEIPAGKLEPGEEPDDCARRELIEEIGRAPGVLTRLSTFYTTPGYSNEAFHLYAAEQLRVESAEESEEEIVGMEIVSIDEATRMTEDGRIEDGKTIAAVGMIKTYLEARGHGRGA